MSLPPASQVSLARTMVGTPYYLSPEICSEKAYDFKSDIWSLGCVLYEMCALRRAFDGKSLPALIVRILDGTYKELPEHVAQPLKDLVRAMLMVSWQLNPDEKKNTAACLPGFGASACLMPR